MTPSPPSDGQQVTRSPVAALDCGTNSTRLLVVDADGRTLERQVAITRLGKGVDATGRLDPEAIERTAAVLRRYRKLMDERGVGSARLVATSAARDASNFEEFAAAAEAAAGVAVELLSGTEEGRLAFRGATAGLDDSVPCLVVDIGGGSTELIAGMPGSEPGFVASLDFGCVRLTEKFFAHDPPREVELRAAAEEVRSLVGSARSEASLGYRRDAFAGHLLVGVAGTVTSLSAISLGLESYDPERVHRSQLSFEEVDRISRELAAETADQRRATKGLEPGRADVIAAGSLALRTLMEELDFQYLLVSESDILDGLVASQLG
jgi:exopolyphosphatase/guanosine-5'-triphosphate,3'-diphosphate pyrophosphatase